MRMTAVIHQHSPYLSQLSLSQAGVTVWDGVGGWSVGGGGGGVGGLEGEDKTGIALITTKLVILWDQIAAASIIKDMMCVVPPPPSGKHIYIHRISPS